MPLSPLQVKNAKPAEKPYKLSDGDGLYLLVQPTGGRLWRKNYRFNGKQKTLALGSFPDTSLAEARAKHAEAVALLANGVDPAEAKQADKIAKRLAAASSFEAVAREWYEIWKEGKATGHHEKVIRRLERDVFPWLGHRPIAEINAPDLLTVVRRIDGRGVRETAHRALQNCGQVFRYAVQTGRAESDQAFAAVDVSGPCAGGAASSAHERVPDANKA